MTTLEIRTCVRIQVRNQSRKKKKKVGDSVEERVAYEVSVSKIALHTEAANCAETKTNTEEETKA